MEKKIEIKPSPYFQDMFAAKVTFKGQTFSATFYTEEDALVWANNQSEPPIPSWNQITSNGKYSCE